MLEERPNSCKRVGLATTSRLGSARQISSRVGSARQVTGRIGSARPSSNTRRPRLHTGRPASAPPGRVTTHHHHHHHTTHIAKPTAKPTATRPPISSGLACVKTHDVGHLNLKVEGKSIGSVAYSSPQRSHPVSRGSVRVVSSHTRATPPNTTRFLPGYKFISSYEAGSDDSESSVLMGFGTTYSLPLNSSHPIIYADPTCQHLDHSDQVEVFGATYTREAHKTHDDHRLRGTCAIRKGGKDEAHNSHDDHRLGGTYTIRKMGNDVHFNDRIPPDGKAERNDPSYQLINSPGTDHQVCSMDGSVDSFAYGNSAYNLRPQCLRTAKSKTSEIPVTPTRNTSQNNFTKQDTDSTSNDGSESTVISLGQKIQLMAMSSPELRRPEENWDSEWKQLLKQNHELLLKLSSREDLRSPDSTADSSRNVDVHDRYVQTVTFTTEEEKNAEHIIKCPEDLLFSESDPLEEILELRIDEDEDASALREAYVRATSPECILEDIIEESGSSNKSSPRMIANGSEQKNYDLACRIKTEVADQSLITSYSNKINTDNSYPILNSIDSGNLDRETGYNFAQKGTLSHQASHEFGMKHSSASPTKTPSISSDFNGMSPPKISSISPDFNKRTSPSKISSDFSCTADLPTYRPGSAIACLVLSTTSRILRDKQARTQPSKDLLDALKMIEDEEKRGVENEERREIEDYRVEELRDVEWREERRGVEDHREENQGIVDWREERRGVEERREEKRGVEERREEMCGVEDPRVKEDLPVPVSEIVTKETTATRLASSFSLRNDETNYLVGSRPNTFLPSPTTVPSSELSSTITTTTTTTTLPPTATLPVLQVLVEKVFLFTQDLAERWKLGGDGTESHEELLRQVVEAEKQLETICVSEGRKRDPNTPPEELHAGCRDEAARRQQETDARIHRNLELIRKLMDDKRTITERCEELHRAGRVVEKKHTDKIKLLEERHMQELQGLKERMAATDQEKREKWTRQKTKAIKDSTYRGVETKMKDLTAKHRDEVSQLKAQQWEDKRQTEEKFVAQLRFLEEEQKKKYEEEKEEACRREREREQQRVEMLMRQSEQHALTRLEGLRRQHERDLKQLVEEHAREDTRTREEVETATREAARERERLKEEHEDKIRQLLRTHQEEIAELRQKDDRAREEWRERLEREGEEARQKNEREVKERLKRQRDREIERAIREVQKDAETGEKETVATCNAKIKSLRNKYELELSEVECSERGARERYLEMRSMLAQKEEEIVYLRARLHTQDLELTELQHMFRPPDD